MSRVRELTESEADVIEAAMEVAMWNEGRHYGPGEKQYKDALRYLMERCADLASEGDGTWRRP